MSSSDQNRTDNAAKSREKRIAEAAERALAEADERRRKAEKPSTPLQKETGGQSGPDPARYGDWEKDGIVSDF